MRYCSASSSASRINNLIKNAIDTNSFIVNSSGNINSMKSSQSIQVAKTRSYDDLSRIQKSTLRKDLLETKDLGAKAQLNSSLSNEDLNSLEVNQLLPIRNGDPVQVRSSSESNLLLDALQNVASKSPKFSAASFSKRFDFIN